MSKKTGSRNTKGAARRKSGQRQTNTAWKRRLLIWGFRAGGLALSALLVFILLVYAGLFGRIPGTVELGGLRNHNASVVYAADGSMIGKYFIQNRLNADNEQISIHVKNALIATEDSRFFEHRGLDFISLGRVFVKTILLRDTRQGGGSTISQQLAKNLYPRRRIGWLSFPVNKTREVFIAARLEKVFSKDDILGLYLNTVPFGEDIYGIEVAANRFFSKSSAQLNPAEAATLVGMLAANTAYSPRLHPERALGRRNVVLDRMAHQGFLSTEDCERYKNRPLQTNYSRIDHSHGPAPWFLEEVRQQSIQLLKEGGHGKYRLETDGLKITTTLDARLQSFAVSAVRQHMSALQRSFNEHWGKEEPWSQQPEMLAEAIRKSPRYRLLSEQGLEHAAIMEKMQKVQTLLVYTPEGEKRMECSPIDSIRHSLRTLHTGFVAMDATSGHVLAWVGGVDFRFYQYDHVKARRQTGSTFKPLVYATALQQGYSPCEMLSNASRTYVDYDNWTPTNADGMHEGWYSLKGGLVHSVNTVTAELIERTGIPAVVSTARKMGIESSLPNVPSLALGSASVSLLEMVSAYTAFPNYGRARKPVMVLRIEDAEGKVLYAAEPQRACEEAFNEETARYMVELLRQAAQRGTGRDLYSRYRLQGDYGGKTGTTQNNADGWFIGFGPRIVAGAWVGAENPGIRFRSTALGQGARTALPIFARVMQQAEQQAAYSYLRSERFYPLPEHLQLAIDCEDYLEDYRPDEGPGFFERLFGPSDQHRPQAAPGDSLDDRGLLRRVRKIFRRD